MTASAPSESSVAVSVAIEDPCSEDARALTGELHDFIFRLYPEDADDEVEPWTQERLAQAGVFVLARIDNAAAGCGGLKPLDGAPAPEALEIVRMYVRPAARGRGVVDKVIDRLEQIALERGATSLVLRCGPRQPDALRVYARNGYSVRGAFGLHRDYPLNIFLEKRLRAGDRQVQQ